MFGFGALEDRLACSTDTFTLSTSRSTIFYRSQFI